MSDRVHFATNNTSIGFGLDNYEFNGFPFFLNPNDQPNGNFTPYLSGDTFSEYCRWLRYRKIHLTGHWEADTGIPGQTDNADFDFVMVYLASTELDIYQPFSIPLGWNGKFTSIQGTQTVPDNTDGHDITLTASVGFSNNEGARQMSDGKRYARFNILIQGKYAQETPTGNFTGTDYGVTWDVLGTTFPSNTLFLTGSPPAPSASGDLTFEVSEYWAYAALDGTPIYDTATGAQLQSPAN